MYLEQTTTVLPPYIHLKYRYGTKELKEQVTSRSLLQIRYSVFTLLLYKLVNSNLPSSRGISIISDYRTALQSISKHSFKWKSSPITLFIPNLLQYLVYMSSGLLVTRAFWRNEIAHPPDKAILPLVLPQICIFSFIPTSSFILKNRIPNSEGTITRGASTISQLTLEFRHKFPRNHDSLIFPISHTVPL